MMRALHRGEVLAMLIDIRTEGDGRWVEFLGRPAYTLIGPAALAASTGAAVVFGYSVRIRPWEYRFVFQPAVGIEPPGTRSGPEREGYVMALLQSLNARLSTVVEQFPEQWMWMHRRHEPVRRSRRKR
jgi:KDO2-lipid IV(A) lauroyltransferase